MPARFLRAAAVLAATCLGCGGAVAQPVTGLYVGAALGPSTWQDTNARGVRIHDQNIGFAGGFTLGWGFGNGLRAELEGGFIGSQIERTNSLGGAEGRSGRADRYTGMVNILYDFDMSALGISPSIWQPYIGIGIGYSYLEIRNARMRAFGQNYEINDGGGGFAVQGILGSAFPTADNWAITTEFRVMETTSPDIRITRPPGGASTPTSFRPASLTMSGMVGIRYAFDAPRTAPQANVPVPFIAATPSVARTYMVFFDFDSAALTERANAVVTEAAANARRLTTTRIEVSGHADRSGTPDYNQRLSQRRGQVVADELIRQGIRRGDIGITAFGEGKPLVPTADGAREPQNRRVEIVLR